MFNLENTLERVGICKLFSLSNQQYSMSLLNLFKCSLWSSVKFYSFILMGPAHLSRVLLGTSYFIVKSEGVFSITRSN